MLATNTSFLRLIPEHLTKYSSSSALRVYRKIQYLVLGTSLVTRGVVFWTPEGVNRLRGLPWMQSFP